MTAFADASAIVKLVVAEDGTDRVAAEPGPIIVSALTFVETASAVWRRARMGSLPSTVAQRTAADLQRQVADGRFDTGSEVAEIPIVTPILQHASRLCGIHSLRAGDAIQLATALTARRLEPSCSRFLVFDRRLADAAAREGFVVVGPEPS
ncbi:MAG: type II toxin-antitoxin system VapC family toxin [Actinobacteria bacterium]|nr:type II toxin-antitoxin system VapC family toxin [Actinomycetota bacterium]